MLNPIADETKWSVAREALGTVVSTYDDSMQIGLTTFPAEGQCSAGQVVVPPAFASAADIEAALQEPPPEGGNWTPMAETLDATLAEPAVNDASIPSYVVLVTDGWQYCIPFDSQTRFAPVDSVEQLTNMGITTFVVGFGDGVDALALNQMAVMAGTQRPGCDPEGDTPMAESPCYYQADSPDQLVDALMDVAKQIPVEEVCDGEDNDCDGDVDEGITQACATDCGMGEATCDSGQFVGCDAPAPEAEICDGADNDCDGSADEVDEGDEPLCGPDDTCEDGVCVPSDDGGSPSGCGCNADSDSRAALGAIVPLFLVLFAMSRRRRRTFKP